MSIKRILFSLSWIAGLSSGLFLNQSQTLCHGFVEENNMNIPVGVEAGGLTETEFNQVLDAVETVYAPIVSSKGGRLQIKRNWTDGTVNASANRSGSTWILNMFGGLARHPAITLEGFTLVACHELGHHLGGAPKIDNGWFSSWASNEGESDYFAVLKCLRKVFTASETENWLKNSIPDPYLMSECSKKYSDNASIALCARTAMAGLSTADLFRDLKQESVPAQFSTPDQKIVAVTDDEHPGTQCRLDTYFQGSLCTIDANTEVDDRDYRKGTCTTESGFQSGVRPLCWFHPSI